MTADWINQDNLHGWLAVVAGFVGALPDEDDRHAIEAGIRDTDVEQERWFEYAFRGSSELHVRVARDPGSSVVFVHALVAEDDRDLALRVETITDVLKTWKLAK